ncbi:hypothetical protein TrLO_g3074 [Triparma laevis f. longispina]|uniref:Uncharacterized protein n=1 Tax=Triparma laevis f. longispina TaxID=1714387 RepID=A0A9W7F992_9STRA|nr:hypothetical protein TrLO_g3074 [Triparma laevis f. longispina]
MKLEAIVAIKQEEGANDAVIKSDEVKIEALVAIKQEEGATEEGANDVVIPSLMEGDPVPKKKKRPKPSASPLVTHSSTQKVAKEN